MSMHYNCYTCYQAYCWFGQRWYVGIFLTQNIRPRFSFPLYLPSVIIYQRIIHFLHHWLDQSDSTCNHVIKALCPQPRSVGVTCRHLIMSCDHGSLRFLANHIPLFLDTPYIAFCLPHFITVQVLFDHLLLTL